MISIRNDGQQLVETNYWGTPQARDGLMFLSGNAGAWRLLVPDAQLHMLAEMRTGRSVTIERAIRGTPGKCVDIVFEDDSTAPFCITLDKRQTDRGLTPGEAVMLIYTRAGLQMEIPCVVKAGV